MQNVNGYLGLVCRLNQEELLRVGDPFAYGINFSIQLSGILGPKTSVYDRFVHRNQYSCSILASVGIQRNVEEPSENREIIKHRSFNMNEYCEIYSSYITDNNIPANLCQDILQVQKSDKSYKYFEIKIGDSEPINVGGDSFYSIMVNYDLIGFLSETSLGNEAQRNAKMKSGVIRRLSILGFTRSNQGNEMWQWAWDRNIEEKEIIKIKLLSTDSFLFSPANSLEF